jgi:hypothetical protein
LIQKDITYENPFNGQQVTETHYFHISKADLVEMEIEEHGTSYTPKAGGEPLTGMQAKLQRIVDTEDGKAIMREFKEIIRRSYGVKEGERFVKTEENWQNFASSEAFSQLLFELCTQADAAAEFVNGVVPGNLDQIAAEVQQQAATVAAGREAQAKAREAAGGQSKDPAATPVEPTPTPTEAPVPVEEETLAQRIERATSENPAELTEAEVAEIDSDVLKSGLATRRIVIKSS